MEDKFKAAARAESSHDEHIRSEKERINAKLRHFRNVTGSVVQDALDTWGDIWNELQGSVTHGVMVTPQAERGFKPECGWPQFLEKMWLLKHRLDYIKRISEGKA